MNTIIRKIVTGMAAIIAAMPLHAEVTPTDISGMSYAIYASAAQAEPGEEVTLSVYMKNANAIATWQADLVLPQGVTIATDEYGDAKVTLSTARTTAARHSVSTNSLANGATRILCASSSNKIFTGTDGEVITITLKIADDATIGQNAIEFDNELMVESNETGHEVAKLISVLEIQQDQDATKCDLNGDGKVDINDVTYLVHYILKKKN